MLGNSTLKTAVEQGDYRLINSLVGDHSRAFQEYLKGMDVSAKEPTVHMSGRGMVTFMLSSVGLSAVFLLAAWNKESKQLMSRCAFAIGPLMIAQTISIAWSLYTAKIDEYPKWYSSLYRVLDGLNIAMDAGLGKTEKTG
jgi:hypothetical protein